MSDINLKRFVNINLRYHQKSTVSSIRDTVVLFETEASVAVHSPYSSYDDFKVDFPEPQSGAQDNYAVTRAYAYIYFNGGGNKLDVRYLSASDATTIGNAIKNLPDELIVVAFAGPSSMSAANKYSLLKGIAQTREADATIYGINQKIILARNEVATDTDLVANFAVKKSDILGGEMTIAAYLSNIDFNAIGTVLDYQYTKEVLTPETSDETVLDAVLANNMNVTMKLAQQVINLGGNLKNGLGLTNQFALITLQQTLTDKVLNVLMTKIKGNSGLAAIQSAVAEEMTRWQTNGYLSLNKVWHDETLKVIYHGVSYTIIEKNEPLTLGYKFVTLPISSLSDEDRQAKKAPPMYLIVAEGDSIRFVAINGDVI